MDLLKQLIESLDEAGRRDFKFFLNRFRKKEERKDMELFNLYVKGKADQRGKAKGFLYPDSGQLTAYHATRKRLTRQLVEFITAKGRSEDVTSERQAENLLYISNYFFGRNMDQAAWAFLKQAEQLALKGDNYKLLATLYSLQIEKSQSEFATDLKQIIKEKERFLRLALEEDNANTAYYLIRHELNNALQEKRQIDINKITRRIVKEFGLTKVVMERPKLMYNIIAITRSTILATKEYHTFEPYVIEKFQQMESKGSFNKYNHFYKVNLLYMIAHVLYRNKKFKEALSYLDILYKNLLEYNKNMLPVFYPKYTLLLAAVYNYSGKNKEAIAVLEKIVNDKKVKLDKVSLFSIYLNLSTYYFQKEEYQKSIRLFHNLQHSDKWLSKIMGLEWVLKKNIIECINQFELGNNDVVDLRIRSMEKNFKELFKLPLYKRVHTFLQVVKQLNKNPESGGSREFSELVNSSFEFISPEVEDIQAMTFYMWIEAKILKRKYYDVLIDSMNFRNRQIVNGV